MPFYDVTDLPDYFRPIIERISDVLDEFVVIDKFNTRWVHFRVPHLVDRCAIAEIEKNNRSILLGEEQKMFPILCPWSSASGSGLWLHYLPDPITQLEYRAGVWYFGS